MFKSQRLKLVIWLSAVVSLLSLADAGANAAEIKVREQIDSAFRGRLAALAAKCDELQLSAQAVLTRNWFVAKPVGRQYLFLEPAVDAERIDESAPLVVQQWHRKFIEERRTYAQSLVELASRQAKSGDGTAAYQLLHEVLRHDPEHVRARQILGYGAARATERITRRAGTSPHPRFGWQRGKYWRVESTHYRITTNDSPEAGVELANKLETLHCVWRQLFFRYWSSDEALAGRFAGKNDLLGKRRTLEVVLFRDRDEYVSQLQKYEPQIAMTLGYYMKGEQIAFFYAGDATVEPTWYHEATHQLFQELGDAVPEVGETSNFWIVEGVALYLESLVPRDGVANVGGVDADRLQYARARGLSGEFYLPLAELVRLGREPLQQHAEIRRIYSQAAGLTHCLMDGDEGRFRSALVDYLSVIYLGRANTATLEKLTGTTLSALDETYKGFLQVRDADLNDLLPPEHRQRLVLAHTAITNRGLEKLADSTALEWLDLSFTAIDDQGAPQLRELRALRRLSVEGTGITDAAVTTVAGLPLLEELDLSYTPITNDALSKLATLKNLKSLWLTKTQVTDAGLTHLETLANLEYLNVNETDVTVEGLNRLQEKLPKLNKQ